MSIRVGVRGSFLRRKITREKSRSKRIIFEKENNEQKSRSKRIIFEKENNKREE